MRAVAHLAAANLALLGSLAAPAVAVLPLRIAALVPDDQRAGVLAMVVAAGGIAALLANPLFGALSDRTTGRWGRRAPWMVGGVIAGTAGVVLLVLADSVPTLLLAWVCTQTAYNAALAAVSALFADSLPEKDRAAASGLFAASTFLGTLPGLLLVALFPTASGVIAVSIAAVAIVVVIACAVRVHDGAGVRSEAEQIDTSDRAVGGPRGFALVWVQRLLMQLAFGFATSFTLYLVLDRMRTTEAVATSAASVNTLLGGGALVVASALVGVWAGRRGNYLPFLTFSALALVAAAVLRAFADAVSLLWISAAVGGLAMGVFFAVDFALALRTIPRGRAGLYLGVLNATETIPQVVAPLLAAVLLGLGGDDPVSGASDNYTALYVAAALVALASAAFLPLLRSVARRPLRADPVRSGR